MIKPLKINSLTDKREVIRQGRIEKSLLLQIDKRATVFYDKKSAGC